MSTAPQIRVLTVDSTGNTDEMPLETLLELLAPMMPAPEKAELEATPAPPAAVEMLKRHVSAPSYLIDMDETSSHWVYAGAPYEMTFSSKASTDAEHSVRVAIRGPGAGTFPQIAEWHTPPPKAGETGRLTVSVLYWRGKPIWGGWWSPLVANG